MHHKRLQGIILESASIVWQMILRVQDMHPSPILGRAACIFWVGILDSGAQDQALRPATTLWKGQQVCNPHPYTRDAGPENASCTTRGCRDILETCKNSTRDYPPGTGHPFLTYSGQGCMHFLGRHSGLRDTRPGLEPCHNFVEGPASFKSVIFSPASDTVT